MDGKRAKRKSHFQTLIRLLGGSLAGSETYGRWNEGGRQGREVWSDFFIWLVSNYDRNWDDFCSFFSLSYFLSDIDWTSRDQRSGSGFAGFFFVIKASDDVHCWVVETSLSSVNGVYFRRDWPEQKVTEQGRCIRDRRLKAIWIIIIPAHQQQHSKQITNCGNQQLITRWSEYHYQTRSSRAVLCRTQFRLMP